MFRVIKNAYGFFFLFCFLLFNSHKFFLNEQKKKQTETLFSICENLICEPLMFSEMGKMKMKINYVFWNLWTYEKRNIVLMIVPMKKKNEIQHKGKKKKIAGTQNKNIYINYKFRAWMKKTKHCFKGIKPIQLSVNKI